MNQIYHCGVQCIVIRRRSVLLGKRYRAAGEGQWALPGGHVEAGESPLQTAVRELAEETTLEGRSPLEGTSFTTDSTDTPYVHVPVIFEEYVGSPQIPPGEKFSELKFFKLNDLPAPLFTPSRIALEQVQEGWRVFVTVSPTSRKRFFSRRPQVQQLDRRKLVV
jgi:8-oxo-dGTP diphosphatase